MEKILECLTDPSWWFTAVFVAFLMSLFAALLVKPLLRLIATRSVRVRAWQAEKDRLLDEQVDEIMKDPTRTIVTYLELIKEVLMVCFFLLLGTATVVISPPHVKPVFLASLVVGLLMFCYSCFLFIKYVSPLWLLTGRISARINAKGKDAP